MGKETFFRRFLSFKFQHQKKKHTKTDCNLEIMTVLLLEKYCLSQHVHIILIIILVKTQLRQEKNLLLHRNPTYLYLYCLTVLYLLFTKKKLTLSQTTQKSQNHKYHKIFLYFLFCIIYKEKK